MLKTSRRRWYVAMPMVLVSSLGLVAASRPTTPLRPCEVVANWVAAHRAELPTTLAEFAKFSKAYQRSIYVSLPPAVRMSIWREHLTPYLAPAAGLNETQRALVRHVLDELEAFVTDATGERGREQRTKENLTASLRGAFSPTQIADIFTLNSVSSAVVGATEGPPLISEETAGDAEESSVDAICDCNVESDGLFDCSSSGCTWDGVCAISFACGVFWTDPCDGVCKQTDD
jgi:hypothetical protein